MLPTSAEAQDPPPHSDAADAESVYALGRLELDYLHDHLCQASGRRAYRCGAAFCAWLKGPSEILLFIPRGRGLTARGRAYNQLAVGQALELAESAADLEVCTAQIRDLLTNDGARLHLMAELSKRQDEARRLALAKIERERRSFHPAAAAYVTTEVAAERGLRSWITVPRRHIFVHPGLTLGGAKTLGGDTAFNLGGEVSAGLWRHPFFLGGVMDGVYDWHRKASRMTVGVVGGAGPVGVDAGYLVELAEGRAFHGGAVRLFFSIGFLALFARYGALRDAPDLVDFGIPVKAPLRFRAVYD